MNNHKLFFLRDKIYLVNFFSCFDFFYKLLHVGGATVSSSSISRVTALLLFWLNYACFVRSSPLQLLDQNCKTVVFRKSEPYIIKESESDKVYQISLYKKSAHALTQKYFFSTRYGKMRLRAGSFKSELGKYRYLF